MVGLFKHKNELGYATSGLIGLITFVVVFKFTPNQLMLPWGSGDILLTYSFASLYSLPENPIAHFGFPYGINLGNFPNSDVVLALMGGAGYQLFKNPYLGVNLFYLLSFVVTPVFGYWLFRKLNFPIFFAITIAQILNILPFHFWRLEHVGLSSYFALVVALGLAIEILQIDNFNFNFFKKKVLAWSLFSVLIATSGLYWTFYSLGILLLAVIVNSCSTKKTSTKLYSAFPLLLASLTFVAAMVPALLFREHIENASVSVRTPVESVIYSGQFSDLIFPSSQSGIPLLGFIQSKLQIVNDWANSEGAIGVRAISDNGSLFILFSVITMFSWAIFKVARPKSILFKNKIVNQELGFLSLLFVVSFLFFVPYGLNEVFAAFISPQIRAWDRLTPVLQICMITFSSVFALRIFRVTTQLKPKLQSSIRWLAFFLCIGILAITFVDTAMPAQNFFTNQKFQAEEFADEAKEVTSFIDSQSINNCGILQLPVMSFPERGPLVSLTSYTPLWLPLEGDNNSWTYAGILGTKQAQWEISASQNTAIIMKENEDICGVVLDKRGFVPEDYELQKKKMESIFGHSGWLSSSGNLLVYLEN